VDGEDYLGELVAAPLLVAQEIFVPLVAVVALQEISLLELVLLPWQEVLAAEVVALAAVIFELVEKPVVTPSFRHCED